MTTSAIANPLSGEDLARYLTATGWKETNRVRGIAAVWQNPEIQASEVLLPLDRSLRDYEDRIRDAINALAEQEGRKATELVRDVGLMNNNLVSVRVVHADTVQGSIPLSDGVSLIAKAKDMLLAAAMAMYSKRRQFSGLHVKAARDYFETLRLGQTEVGSFVVNIIAPIGAVPSGGGEDSEPIGSAVTHSLVIGLKALTHAADVYRSSGSLKAFETSVTKGVSANLCDAVIGLSGQRRNRDFEVTVRSSPSPFGGRREMTFHFDLPRLDAVSTASAFLKNDYVAKNLDLVGFVRKLNRARDSEAGTVTMETEFGGIERLVQIELSGEEYHLAVTAHDQKAAIACSGDVHVKSKSAIMTRKGAFRIIASMDLFKN